MNDQVARPILDAASRYDQKKQSGATYTPAPLADFVASQILGAMHLDKDRPVKILDPAAGDGALLVAMIKKLQEAGYHCLEVFAFDIDQQALDVAQQRLRPLLEKGTLHLVCGDFLQFASKGFKSAAQRGDLISGPFEHKFDMVISNPPYVRTQVMGAEAAQSLAGHFGLSGRVDLYHAFLLAISGVLNSRGVLGIIVSNRFMTTRSGAAVRAGIAQHYNIRQVWDLGDTKIFKDAVLPAVLLLGQGPGGHAAQPPRFTRVYSVKRPDPPPKAADLFAHLSGEQAGVIDVQGTCYEIQNGVLSGKGEEVWRIATDASEEWLATVARHTFCTFKEIGKIRVGVKTTADSVFIRTNWDRLGDLKPEDAVLHPLITHHDARRWKGRKSSKSRTILYTHIACNGKRQAIRLEDYPRAGAYLEQHAVLLKGRAYVTAAGRAWYEVWVPQDPALWPLPKLIFRDISEIPTFWLDQDASVVNGDCYWLAPRNPGNTNLLWLALAIGNSKFIEHFYDHKFHNKLYAGRRRFMTQYVEHFPVPAPETPIAVELIATAKRLYETVEGLSEEEVARLAKQIDTLVWRAFGLAEED